jgi:hypothetical protein
MIVLPGIILILGRSVSPPSTLPSCDGLVADQCRLWRVAFLVSRHATRPFRISSAYHMAPSRASRSQPPERTRRSVIALFGLLLPADIIPKDNARCSFRPNRRRLRHLSHDAPNRYLRLFTASNPILPNGRKPTTMFRFAMFDQPFDRPYASHRLLLLSPLGYSRFFGSCHHSLINRYPLFADSNLSTMPTQPSNCWLLLVMHLEPLPASLRLQIWRRPRAGCMVVNHA